MNCQDIERNITSVYMAFMLELERQRLARGLSMAEITDHAGIADGLYGKSLYASTPSGRQSNWRTLQDLVDALYPMGFDIIVKPKTGQRLDPSQLRCKIKSAQALTDTRSQREFMRELSHKGVEARRTKFAAMTEEQRKRAIKHIVKKAKKTKRKNRLLRLQQAAIPTIPKRRRTAVVPCVVTTAAAAPSFTMDGIGSSVI
jgi:hypothetical protein